MRLLFGQNLPIKSGWKQTIMQLQLNGQNFRRYANKKKNSRIPNLKKMANIESFNELQKYETLNSTDWKEVR